MNTYYHFKKSKKKKHEKWGDQKEFIISNTFCKEAKKGKLLNTWLTKEHIYN